MEPMAKLDFQKTGKYGFACWNCTAMSEKTGSQARGFGVATEEHCQQRLRGSGHDDKPVALLSHGGLLTRKFKPTEDLHCLDCDHP